MSAAFLPAINLNSMQVNSSLSFAAELQCSSSAKTSHSQQLMLKTVGTKILEIALRINNPFIL